MSKLPVYITLLLVAALAWGCSKSAPADPVAQIAAAVASGNDARAQRSADRLLADSTAFTALSAGQLCRLSQALVHLSSATDDATDNEASAARCLARARALQPDTVAAFLSRLSGDDAGRLMVLDRVGAYLEIPRDSLVTADEATDSTDTTTYHTHE